MLVFNKNIIWNVLKISQVLIEIHNGEHVGMFLFAFWVIRTLTCEVVNFLKYKLAGVPIRQFNLSAPILLRACAPCTHAHDVHAHCDITRFAYDANHFTMTSPVFTFYSCHIGMTWHDVIGVCIVGTSDHHGLHHMGMT